MFGSDVAAGDLVRVSLTAANRDPAVFAHPDQLDLHRPNVRDQLSFARGPHVCIAADLARLETRTAVALALRELPRLRLERDVSPSGHVFRRPRELPVAGDVAR